MNDDYRNELKMNASEISQHEINIQKMLSIDKNPIVRIEEAKEHIMDNKTVNRIFNLLMDDKDLLNTCEKRIKEVIKDKKITSSDIPSITLLLTSGMSVLEDIQDVKEENIKEALILFIMSLIKKSNPDINLVSENMQDVISGCLDLLFYKLKKASLIKRMCKKLKRYMMCL